MQPEQMRAARAALNWSLERLAEEFGVHRNTLSNFETRKFDGEPEKIAAAERSLRSAGVVFINERHGETPGIKLRRFRVGDQVRLRPQTRVRFSYDVAPEDTGTVVAVEPHPPQTGPTYRIAVKFGRAEIPYVFRYEYELVKAVESFTDSLQLGPDDDDQRGRSEIILDEFCVICEATRTDFELYKGLFESTRSNLDLFDSIAPYTFADLAQIMKENLLIKCCKLTDPANTRKNSNLTTNFIIEYFDWPIDVRRDLEIVNDRLMTFRDKIEPARSKRLAHCDLPAQVLRKENMGKFREGDDFHFFRDLQEFINIAYGQLYSGRTRSIAASMSTDSFKLIRALEKAVLFDRCQKCDEHERAVAVLDYEDHH